MQQNEGWFPAEGGKRGCRNSSSTVGGLTFCSTSTSWSKSCKQGRAARREQACLYLSHDCMHSQHVISHKTASHSTQTYFRSCEWGAWSTYSAEPVIDSSVHVSLCVCLHYSNSAEEVKEEAELSLCLVFGSSCWPRPPCIQAPQSQCCVNTDSRAQCERILLSGVPKETICLCVTVLLRAQLENRQRFTVCLSVVFF